MNKCFWQFNEFLSNKFNETDFPEPFHESTCVNLRGIDAQKSWKFSRKKEELIE